jgi:hypothetical protein
MSDSRLSNDRHILWPFFTPRAISLKRKGRPYKIGIQLSQEILGIKSIYIIFLTTGFTPGFFYVMKEFENIQQ